MQRVAIVGAGAIGGFIGTRLALAGRTEISGQARGLYPGAAVSGQ